MKLVHMLGATGLTLWPLVLIHFLGFQIPLATAQGVGEPGGTCSDTIPCYQGCCSKEYSCGFTPDHCGDGCKSSCNATAECGQYAPPENFDCPINVCCSGFGYCGVTSEFCGDGCEPNSNGGGCGDPSRPTCSDSTDAMSYDRRIGYYELFNIDKSCNVIEPESLVIEPFSHINLAFVNFGDDFNIVDEYGDIVDRMSFLKFSNPGLRLNIAVGGWTFSDIPTQQLWTEMAGSYENRQTFINSVVKYLQDYHLDGIDLDWEYPGAADRGGRSQDATNYVTLLAEMREAFDRENPGWEISATIPTSYWYLRGFDVKGMQKYLDYFNLMSYDLHGMWDQNIKFTGPYLEGHTDISQIELGLDLLWRNDIDPSNVVFGFAFYGRSFTMKDSSCSKPDGKCEFSDGGIAGSCTDTTGILSYAEISSRNNSLDVHTSYDPETTVKYNVYGGTQWISYDDEQSFSDKKRFVSKRCLSGWMVWAIDQDNGEFDALTGLIGEDLSSLQMKSNEDSRSSHVLADAFAAYTGQNCFVTDRCTDGSNHEKNPDQVCPSGYLSVSTAHNPLQAGKKERHGDCDEGWYRQICCPKDAMPKSCEWNGAPERSEFGCDGKCGSNQFKLNQDTALDAKGEGQCFTGARFLCCDSAAIFSTCDWTDCQGPLVEEDPTTCPTGTDYKTYRFDKPNGKPWCSDTYISPVPGYPPGSPHKTKFKSGLCCDSDQSFRNCKWTNVLTREELGGDTSSEHIADLICKPRPCPAGSVKIAGALDPPLTGSGANGGIACGSYDVDAGMDPEWSYCCSPPTKYNKNWPVDPKYLWAKYYNDPDKSDVAWKYSDQYQNNDADQDRSSEEDGSDAYGFVMLDGPDGSLDNDFASSQTVVRRSEKIVKTKRSILTSNQTVMDSVFDHAEETFHVYCNYPADSKECKRVFIDGAEDTIISLPPHVGEGPFARIVSMKEADGDFQLPDHHLAHRSLEHLENPVYEVKIDYNFQNIKLKRDDEPVQIRVDYTNLMGYWDEMTDSPASRMKRSVGEQGLSEPEWRSRVQRAVSRDKNVRKREENIKVKTAMDTSDPTPAHNKRWFGVFGDWLSKLTTVTKSSVGVIELGFSKTINLFYAQWGCPGKTYYADLRMDLEADLAMDATYAYYLSATFIPPSKPETFAYFGMEPQAYIGLHIEGNAQMQTPSVRKKIVDTLSYPGLAVKGIAAVGPTLDIYGEIRGKITLHGELDAGAMVTFGKAEVYWPQNDEAQAKYGSLLGITSDAKAPAPGSIKPVFHAGVAVDAQLDVIVTPEANVGIKIGGGKLVGGKTLMDAQLTGYVTGDLSFQAHGDYDSSDNAFHYRFGAYLLYNLGYKAKANILGFIDWALAPRKAFTPDNTVTLYEKKGTIPMSSSDMETRDLSLDSAIHRRQGSEALSTNATMPYLDAAMGLTRREDGSADNPNDSEFSLPGSCPPGTSGFQVPEIRFNCAHLSRLKLTGARASNQGKTAEVAGFCDTILKIPNLPTDLTYSNDKTATKARYEAQCGSTTDSSGKKRKKGACADETDNLNALMGTGSALKLQCDEFPWKSSEQGGHYLDSNSRRAACVPYWQNNWHGQCLAMIGDMSSNWKMLDADTAKNDDVEDFWVPWRNDKWTRTATFGTNNEFAQKLKEYGVKQPPPDGISVRNNDKESWTFKRDYRATWITDGSKPDDWWNFVSRRWYSEGYEGDAGGEAIFCAMNHFGQDNVYKLETEKGKKYNGFCLRNDGSGMASDWQQMHNLGKCLITFGNTQGQTPDSTNTKRDSQSWNGWEVERVEFVD